MNSVILTAGRVVKRFAGHTAVDRLSLTVPKGVIYGLLGPNGAGKTTMIRMIMNVIVPDEGTVRLFDAPGTARDFSARIGFLPEERGLYPKMRVLDVLLFLAETRGVDRRSARVKALQWLERLGLAGWRMREVSGLSKGVQEEGEVISHGLDEPRPGDLGRPFSGPPPGDA